MHQHWVLSYQQFDTTKATQKGELSSGCPSSNRHSLIARVSCWHKLTLAS